MADYRVTFGFETYNGGFTENWYITQASRPEVMVRAKKLWLARLDFLSDKYYQPWIRICDVNAERDADVFGYSFSSGIGVAPSSGAEDEVERAAINCRVFSGSTRWRSWLIRGLPTGAVLWQGGGMVINPAWTATTNTFRSLLATDGWALRRSALSDARTVTTYTTSGRMLIGITINAAAPGTWLAGRVIKIGGCINVAGLNANWRIIDVGPTATAFALGPHRKPTIGDEIPINAVARLVTYSYPAITNSAFINVTSRKSGRPLFVPRGRRSVQLL